MKRCPIFFRFVSVLQNYYKVQSEVIKIRALSVKYVVSLDFLCLMHSFS